MSAVVRAKLAQASGVASKYGLPGGQTVLEGKLVAKKKEGI
jgi:hypothetical protein